ncbi:tudor domain-containing 6 isoform X2 [Archocentrus centrarchus]|uniref:tudor domain-containing 6 isoform X2 n=1 Tax=Archocentrus centrarchus TaxID=63155 RepID=UPI0011EA40B0|nr:tudor domain-containing protein 6-like isoform X2 [Archocentrus centrarchus]
MKAKMSSIPGLPTRGSYVTVIISRVHLNHLCVLVEFWAKFSQERSAEYECLAKDIQSPGDTFQELEGKPGHQCLVQIEGFWYRARIVSRNGSNYTVFLVDKGMTFSATTNELAWGTREYFQLPPEVEFCVLANVLPLSPENRWSPVALEFLKSLPGKSVSAYVQEVLVVNRTFLLHIPCISKQMYEMGFARKLSPNMFQDFVLLSLQSQSGAKISPENQQLSVGTVERLHKQVLFMYPELQGGTVETVIVTEVTNPQRIFCQLKVFSQELKKLSDQLTQSCEGRMSNCIVGPEMIGFPCAARSSDGRWYRSVLQHVFPTSNVVEVLNVDYGTKQLVQVENVRPLASEFFRMPVVTYICSLHGVNDKGVVWTTSQIDYLKSLLLYKTVIVKFEYQSISEGVHYVTFYGDNNTNINMLFGFQESCLLDCKKTLEDYAIRNTAHSHKHPAQQERTMLSSVQAMEEKEEKAVAERVPAEVLPLNSSHVAAVQDLINPSEFYIQTQNYTKQLNELMDKIYHLYKDSLNKDAVRIPTAGLYCAARAADGDFYRAIVTEVGETHAKVFFVDYGNTEVVDRRNLRILPAEFKKLPRLALKCTLAGVKPKDERWSQRASAFFSKAVTDKELNVHVLAKYDNSYAVQLTDPKAQEERDVGTLMCNSGFAERADMPRQRKATIKMQSDDIPPTHPDASLPGVNRNTGLDFRTQNTIGLGSNERRIATYKEHMFPIGSVLDVSVSYIESPNDFWCQLVHNAGHLKLLMHDIQAHYAGSEFQQNVETVCVARHPDNRLWYRALVIHKHETPHVDVLFVDYGQTETVSLHDLRRIRPEFLILHGQAFRCSLLNPIDPTSAINEWSKEAVARFHNFVNSAASNFVILKCTVYAVMYSEQKIVFNIVDLETPFESVSTSMVNLMESAPPKKAAGASFRLDTYYYSTHDVKTGTEEVVTVTCVNSVNQFYCHLEKNADVMNDLKMKVRKLCHQLENVTLPAVFGTLCFARYTDGQWYRGQIKATKPVLLVHFVDYGDTIEVDKADLLPVPREANDIMSVPVQAVMCGLSDVPANVSSEVDSWFETTATECKFQALVVAREPDGKLLVELYHGNTQINSKLKKKFQIKMRTESQVVYQGRRAPETSAAHSGKMANAYLKQATNMEDDSQLQKKNSFSASKPLHFLRDGRKSNDMNPWNKATKSVGRVNENGQKVKSPPLELYSPPHQRQSCERMPDASSELAGDNIKPSDLPTDAKLIKPTLNGLESQKESIPEKLPKLSDLPSNSIAPDMVADVYVSQCNSPLSFYVQCVSEEDEIFSLVEKLNDPKSTPEANSLKDVHPGDLVQAEFSDDSSWYRAVVREIHGNKMALIEFVDFGNTAMTPLSKIGRLHKNVLQLPVYSTHCMLSDAASLGKEVVLDPDVVSAFKEDIAGSGGKLLKCQFVRQIGSVWEVNLEYNGVNITCKVPTRDPEITSEKPEQIKEEPSLVFDIRDVPENTQISVLSQCSSHNFQENYFEGLKLEVCITVINDNQTFWCQSARSEELEKINLSLSEVGNLADHNCIDPDALCPGSLCIALFSDDQLWYRAEVIDKIEDKLSVFFVDYGNKSQVSIADVREMLPFLLEIPPQAFLCELEGFDASCGSWESGAAVELSTLTADKLVQVTVTKQTRATGKIFVRMECEGQVINEVMKTWWKCFPAEDKPEADEGPDSDEPPLQVDPTVNESVVLKDQVEHPKIQEVASSHIHFERDNSDEFSNDEFVDLCTADEVLKSSSSPKNSKSSKDSIHPDSFIESPKEGVSTERIIVQASAILIKDNLPCDSGIDETILSPLDNISCNTSVEDTNKSTEEESASVMVTVGSDNLCSPVGENLFVAMDDSETTATTDKEPVLEEVDTAAYSADMNISDPVKNGDDETASVRSGTSLYHRRAVSMIPTELVLPSPLPPGEQLFGPSAELECEAEDGIAQQEVLCATTQAESDSVHEESSLAHLDNPKSDTDTAASEPNTCTVPSLEKDDEVEEVTCCIEETCSADVCTEQKEPSSDGDDCLSCVTAEEMVQHGSVETPSGNTVEIDDVALQHWGPWTSTPSRDDLIEDETLDLHEDALSVLASEPQTCTAPSPDLSNLVEEVTCLVGEICLTDACQDLKQEAEMVTEDCELQVHASPQQNKDFDDGALTEEMSSAEDSFAIQLSTITHLSLIVTHGSADNQPAEQQQPGE